MNRISRIVGVPEPRTKMSLRRVQSAVIAIGLVLCAPGLVSAQSGDPYIHDMIPANGATIGSSTVQIRWTACSSKPQSGSGWSFQTTVNGTAVSTQPFQTPTGPCPYAYNSGYVSPSGTLRVGRNDITARICTTTTTCGTTSWYFNYSPATPGISITPDGGVTTNSILVGGSGSYAFTVTNTGGVAATPTYSFSCPGILTNCSVSPSASGVLNPGEYRYVTASYQGASAGTTNVTVGGSYAEYPSTTDNGFVSQTVTSPPPSYSVSVSVDDNDPINLSPGATTMTQRYTIANTSQNTSGPITFSLVMSTTGTAVSSCPTLSPMQLNQGSANSIFVTCNIAPSSVPTTGTVRLTASGSGASGFVERTVNATPATPIYAVTVTPVASSATAPARSTSGSQTFTIRNNSQNTTESNVSLSHVCSGALFCYPPMNSVTIPPNTSLDVSVPYGISLTGVNGTLQVTAGVGNASGTNSMTVNTTPYYESVVLRENASQTLPQGATSGSTRFTVKNNSSNTMAFGATRRFDLAAVCGSSTIPTCSSAPASVDLRDQDSTATWGVTASYNVTTSGPGGTVQLSASSAGLPTVSASTTINATPSYSVTVGVDDNNPINLSPGATSMTQHYTIANTSNNTSGPITFSLVMSGTLPGLSCPTLSSMPLNEHTSNSIFVTCNIAPSSVPTSGTVRLTASGSGAIGWVERTVNTTPATPIYALTVVRQVSSVTAAARSTSGSQIFRVTNNSQNTTESNVSLSRICSGALTCSPPMNSVTIPVNSFLDISVPYGIQLVGVNGTLKLNAAVGTSGTASDSMTVNTTPYYEIIVTRENATQTLVAAATTGSTRFTVKNNSSNTVPIGSTRTFTLTPSCTSTTIINCTSNPASVALRDQDSTATWGVTVNYSVSNTGTSGPVVLSASSPGLTTVSASTTVNTTPYYALAVIPQAPSATDPARATTGSKNFTVRNDSRNISVSSVALSRACSPSLTCTTTMSPVTINAGSSQLVSVPYGILLTGTSGTLQLTASIGTTSNTGAMTITPTPYFEIAVVRENASQTLPVLATSGSTRFTVKNNSSNTVAAGSTRTFSLAASCSAPVTSCTPTPSSVALRDQDSTATWGVTVNYTVSGSGPATPVQLSASSAGMTTASASTTVNTTAVAPALSITPDGGTAPSLIVGGSGSFAFKFKNTGNVPATPTVTPDCSSALQSCAVSGVGGALSPGDSVTLTTSYQAASSGIGHIALTGHFAEYPAAVDTGTANLTVSDAPVYSVSVSVMGSEPVNVLTGTTNISQTYTVTNTSKFTTTSSQFTLVLAKTGAVTSCPTLAAVTLFPGQSYTTTVACTITTSTPTTGTVRLTATASAPVAMSAYVQRTVNLPASWGPTIDVSMNNPDLPSPSLCEVSCFAATTSFSTVPYFSLDQPRNVTLVYNGDQAVPRPFIYADVEGAAGVAVTRYTMQATLNGTAVTFLNGQTLLTFTGSQLGQPVRLGGQFDARTIPTGVYPLVVTVQATYANGITGAPTTVNSYFTIINEGSSEIAKGWTVAGRQRLYLTNGLGYLITNGDGSGTRFPALGVVAADFSTLTYDAATTTYTRTYADGTRALFNGTLQHTATVAPNGQRVSYAYDAQGRLQYIGDPFRKQPGGALTSITLAYDANGLHSIQEPGADGTLAAGRVTSFVVNSSKCLVTATDPDGIASTFTCDSNGRLATLKDRQASLTTIVYGASWKLSQIKLPTIPVDAGNGTTSNTIPIVNYTPWQTQGVPTSSTTNNKPWTAPLVSSITGSTTDPIGRVTAFKPNQFGQAIDVTDPLGRHTVIDSSFTFLPRRIRHPNGRVDSLEYDTKGHVVSTHAVGGARVDYHYNGAGLLDVISGPGMGTDTLYYSSKAQLTRVVQAGDPRRAINYTYDAATSRVASITDPAGHISSYSYDPTFGNQSQATLPGARTTTSTFDSYGRPRTTQSAGLPAQTTDYDLLNRPTSVLDGVNPKATRVGYNAMFQLTVTDPKDQVFKTDRNALGWPIRSYDPNTSFGSKLMRYDAAGRLTGFTNRRGQKLTFTYDALDRLLVKAGTNTTSDTLFYSLNDSISAGRNAVEKDSVFVDPTTQADSVVILLGGGRFRIAHTSHPEFSVPDTVSFANTAGTILSDRVFQADPNTGALSSVNFWGATVGVGHDVNGARTGISLGDFGQTQTRTSLESILEQSYGYDPTFHRAYHYDLVGRIDAEQSSSPTSAISQRAFSYDQLGRLQRVETRQQPSCDFWPSNTIPLDSLSADNGWRYTCVAQPATTESFSYDEVGNRTDNGATTIVGNRYQTFKGVTYTYDLDGNVTRKTKGGSFDRTYTWSAENRLLSASDGTTTVRYEYNAFGQPVKKWLGPTGSEHVNRYFIWDGQHLIATLDSVLQRVEEYEYASGVDDPIVFASPGAQPAVRAPVKDGFGNVVGFGDSNIFFGHEPTSYDTWGTPSNSGTQQMSLQWKGLMWQGDVAQLSYAQNRWYDPDAGRFMSEDPLGIGTGLNLYVFANNDPVNGSDPFGLDDPDCPYGTVLFEGRCQPMNPLEPVYVGGCEPGYEYDIWKCDQMNRALREAREAWLRATDLSPWNAFGSVGLEGPPNTFVENGVNLRLFGPDGWVKTDFDFHRPHGNQTTPHAHDWGPEGQGRGQWRPVKPGEIASPWSSPYTSVLSALNELLRSRLGPVLPIFIVRPSCPVTSMTVSGCPPST